MAERITLTSYPDGEVCLNEKWHKASSVFGDDSKRLVSFVIQNGDGAHSPVNLNWEGISTKVVVDRAGVTAGMAAAGAAAGTIIPGVGNAAGAAAGAVIGFLVHYFSTNGDGYYVTGSEKRVHNELLLADNAQHYRKA